jgi:N-acetylglucosaminyldiphosphoundecaprenol N-acetyl-beta-D-mannosaminyltransferase
MDTAVTPTVPAREPIDFCRPLFCVFGTAFDLLPMEQVLGVAGRAFKQRTRLVLSTPNVNNIVAFQSDAAFRESVARCNLVVADGMPVVWCARLLGIPASRIAGSDFFERLMAGEAGLVKVFFFGGPEGVAIKASDALTKRANALRGVGGLYPGFGSVADMAAPHVVKQINEAQPDFLIVALGTAKGQAWIEQIQPQLSVPLISHLGAVVNFAAGSIRRAPHVLQITGMEWMWRIWEEPALWRRYAKDAKVLARLVATSIVPLFGQRLLNAVRPHGPRAEVQVEVLGQSSRRLVLSGNWDNLDARLLGEALNRITATPGDIEIVASKLGRVDQRVIAQLIRLRGLQMTQGTKLVFRQPSHEFLKTLQRHCASYLVADLPVASSAPLAQNMPRTSKTIP